MVGLCIVVGMCCFVTGWYIGQKVGINILLGRIERASTPQELEQLGKRLLRSMDAK